MLHKTLKSAVMRISPKYTEEKLKDHSVESKIDVFEDQLTGLVFRHARALPVAQYEGHDWCCVAILMLCVPYFELIASCMNGRSSRGKERSFFLQGFLDVFTDLQQDLKSNGEAAPEKRAAEIAAVIYEELRCGLAHELLMRGRIALGGSGTAITVEFYMPGGYVGPILIDPPRFLFRIEDHFQRYLARLRSPDERRLREQFEAYWKSREAHVWTKGRG